MYINELTWIPEFETGDVFYDNLHKKFLDIINMARKVIYNRTCEEEISLIYFRLIYFIENNVVEEENYLKENTVSSITLHRKEHNHLIKTIIHYQNLFFEGDRRSCQKLLVFLRDWFQEHMLDTDKQALDKFKTAV